MEHGLTPAAHSLDQVRYLDRLARRAAGRSAITSRSIRAWGAWERAPMRPEILAALAETPHARLEGLMTHFASAADYTTRQTDDSCASTPLPASCGKADRRGIPAHFQHQCHRLRPRARLAQHGARRPRAVWLRFAGARRGAAPIAGGAAGPHLEGQASGRERHSRGRTGGLWRHVPRAARHAHRHPERGLRRWRVSPALQPRESHRRRPAHLRFWVPSRWT